MRRTQLVAAVLVCTAIGLPRAGSAQNAPPPTILNVTTDAAGDQLTITGSGFGPAPGRELVVGSSIEDSGSPFTTALGYQAAANTTGLYNTATGWSALVANTTGGSNTASGFGALQSNTTGSTNTASGFGALYANTAGYGNVASGYQALFFNTLGGYNTANGWNALAFNTGGVQNTASGMQALFSNTNGFGNTATGFQALAANTGDQNTATGQFALISNTRGYFNTASGESALARNTTGAYNTALGRDAGYNAAPTANFNLFLGAFVTGTASDTNTIRIGLPYDGTNGQNQTFIAGIRGTTVTGGLPVVIDANGQLGTTSVAVTDSMAVLTKVAQEQQQHLHDQQVAIADLQARLARLESLLTNAAGAGGR
jgi:hypothetical protein